MFLEQLTCGLGVEAIEIKPFEACERTRCLVVDGEQHRYPLDVHPSRGDGERGYRSRINQVRVGDHAEDGTEDRAARKPRRRCEVERRVERVPLRCRNLSYEPDDRRDKLVEARKGNLRLVLDTG